jgi:hypothetical protein
MIESCQCLGFGRGCLCAIRCCSLVLCWMVIGALCYAQMETATLSGTVMDLSGAVVADAQVQITNSDTNVTVATNTNKSGIYVIPSLKPGRYRIAVTKVGFKQVVVTDVILNVQDVVSRNFNLQVGAVSESVTVTADQLNINTTDATVSTVVNRNFADNLPLNGRSFQTLIQLTPGVVLTPYSNYDNGQFSVNGQRADSNYWMLDGVSANVGIGTSLYSLGNGLSGSNAATSVIGSTNSLVSVEALQEFRIMTSTFAPEFGRTPGGQVSIVTRAGTNQFHGNLFEYLRNDVLDANDWFADHNQLPKPEERQNDFGGTFSGPILKNRTFFFFSYEGFRLRLPKVAHSSVPDLSARANADPAMQPYLNSFPLPSPGIPDDLADNLGIFNASYSDKATLDATSLRIDHKISAALNLFGRYNYSPSSATQRGASLTSLNTLTDTAITLHTATVGLTWTASQFAVNDVRFNYSHTASTSMSRMDSFGSGKPLTSLPFPSGFNATNALFILGWDTLGPYYGPNVGLQGNNAQRQINVVDDFSLQKARHSMKFGVDWRHLFPTFHNAQYNLEPEFADVPSSLTGSLEFAAVGSGRNGDFSFNNLGVFGQDTWRATERLTLTYGLRWDVDFAPSSSPPLLAVTGFNLNDMSQLALARAGTAPFATTYSNFAPRLGVAYGLRRTQGSDTVLRGGVGVFYDLATSQTGNSIYPSFYPFGAVNFYVGAPFGGPPLFFPLDPVTATPPPISVSSLQFPGGAWGVFDPHLKLPYSVQWNLSLEQALGVSQSISASYVGATGRRLLQSARVVDPSPEFGFAGVIANAATSDYHSLQLQFRRRLNRGLQALASYTWSHSIDTASAGSAFGNTANVLLPGAIESNRGPSDFDIRNAFSLGATYELPYPKAAPVVSAFVRGWSLQSVFQARSAPPVSVSVSPSITVLGAFEAQQRPDLVANVPVYLYGSQYPGGKALNPQAFSIPPTGQQGDLGRNALRGFGAWQWDFSIHRNFALGEHRAIEFRSELFNVLNHPNFGPPLSSLAYGPNFGMATQTLGQSLAGANIGSGGFNPLYQIGGPRSVQFALKFLF